MLHSKFTTESSFPSSSYWFEIVTKSPEGSTSEIDMFVPSEVSLKYS